MARPAPQSPTARCVVASLFLAAVLGPGHIAMAGDGEFTGKFEPQLVDDPSGRDQVVFSPARDAAQPKPAKPIESGSEVTVGWLFDPRSEKSAIKSLLVEEPADSPYLLADVDLDGQLGEKERFDLSEGEGGNPYLWEGTVAIPLGGGPFAAFPLHVRYLKNVRSDEMKEGDRLVLESRTAFARGVVDIQGQKTLVEYPYSAKAKRVDLRNGSFGVDTNGDGTIDRARFSPENADASDEVVVFRAGSLYVSTKRADVEKNEIVMRTHKVGDYKRIELSVGAEMPDFEFTDFAGKKRRLSEFRGKVVLLDFWGTWCPPCRGELPYLKETYSRFQPRGFEIVGMNTDEPELVPQIKTWLEKNGLDWTQAKRETIAPVIQALRIHTFPTTILIGADGKVISLGDEDHGQPGLRGNDLIKSVGRVVSQ
jgi:peroxiredoxin